MLTSPSFVDRLRGFDLKVEASHAHASHVFSSLFPGSRQPAVAGRSTTCARTPGNETILPIAVKSSYVVLVPANRSHDRAGRHRVAGRAVVMRSFLGAGRQSRG